MPDGHATTDVVAKIEAIIAEVRRGKFTPAMGLLLIAEVITIAKDPGYE